jgi:hypothetical protein
MFGFGPEHTHHNPMERTISQGNVATLTTQWRAPTGAPVSGSPGRLLRRQAVRVRRGWDHELLPCDTASVRAVLDSQNSSSPAVSNGVVYSGSDDHNLFAFGS